MRQIDNFWCFAGSTTQQKAKSTSEKERARNTKLKYQPNIPHQSCALLWM